MHVLHRQFINNYLINLSIAFCQRSRNVYRTSKSSEKHFCPKNGPAHGRKRNLMNFPSLFRKHHQENYHFRQWHHHRRIKIVSHGSIVDETRILDLCIINKYILREQSHPGRRLQCTLERIMAQNPIRNYKVVK